jgi:hypothetical protein
MVLSPKKTVPVKPPAKPQAKPAEGAASKPAAARHAPDSPEVVEAAAKK